MKKVCLQSDQKYACGKLLNTLPSDLLYSIIRSEFLLPMSTKHTKTWELKEILMLTGTPEPKEDCSKKIQYISQPLTLFSILVFIYYNIGPMNKLPSTQSIFSMPAQKALPYICTQVNPSPNILLSLTTLKLTLVYPFPCIWSHSFRFEWIRWEI